MTKKQETAADVYRRELRALKAREDLLQLRLTTINRQIVEVMDKMQEAEDGGE